MKFLHDVEGTFSLCVGIRFALFLTVIKCQHKQ